MKKIILACALLLATTSAFAQSGTSVKQSGNITPNQVPNWVTSGVIGGGTTAVDSPISSFGVTGPICSNSARTASGAWNSLCVQANTNSAAIISLQNYGTATPQGLNIVINGVTTAIAGVTLPVTDNDVAIFNGTTGLLKNSGIAVASGGGFVITPTPSSAVQGINVSQTGPTSGTTVGVVSSCTAGNPTLAYNQTCITNEGASITGATDPKFTIANNVAMLTGGTNSTGGKIAQNVFLQKFSASTPGTARDHIALNAQGLIDAGDGGTSTALGQSKGTMFGAGISATARTGATNLFELTGLELDVALQTGSSATYRFGVNIVDTGNIRAAVQDAAIAIGGGVSSWGNGLLFSDLNGGMPICSTCFLIKAATSTPMTIDSAIDFGTNVVITSYLLRGPGGYIDGSFNLVGASASLGGPGTSSGVLSLKGSTSGVATLVTQAVQGANNIIVPTNSGTFAVSASAPLALNAATGNISLSASISFAPTFLSATAIPAGGTTGSCIMFTSTANFGVCPGSGAPTLSAAKGSLYLRSDGSTTNDRAYINTNGSTTWTPLTTGS